MDVTIISVTPHDAHNPAHDRVLIEHERLRTEWGRNELAAQQRYLVEREAYDRAASERNAWRQRAEEDPERAGDEPFVPPKPDPPRARPEPEPPQVSPTKAMLRIDFRAGARTLATYVDAGADRATIVKAMREAVRDTAEAAVRPGDRIEV